MYLPGRRRVTIRFGSEEIRDENLPPGLLQESG
jgi:hypothetical protein